MHAHRLHHDVSLEKTTTCPLPPAETCVYKLLLLAPPLEVDTPFNGASDILLCNQIQKYRYIKQIETGLPKESSEFGNKLLVLHYFQQSCFVIFMMILYNAIQIFKLNRKCLFYILLLHMEKANIA